MAGVKISNLPAIVAPALSDIFPVTQGGVTYKETITQLAALLVAPLTGASTQGVQNQQYSYAPDTGAVNAYVGVMSPAVTAYVAGQRFDLLISNTNTGASTLQINALAAQAIKRADGTALVAGDLIAGQISTFEYDGTNFQLMTTVRRLLGTATNNNAAAGYVGEFISSQVLIGSAIALTTATATNVTSISLTAGDWDVNGNIFANGNAGVIGQAYFWTSSTSATLPDSSLVSGTEQATNDGITAMATPYKRYSLSGTTTIYLSTYVTFGSGTVHASGGIYARRAT